MCRLRFGLTSDDITVSVLSACPTRSPYSGSVARNIEYPACLCEGNVHYWVWSLDCTEIYNSDTIEELSGYEGDFYSSKVFVDGELLYDTYYSKEQYDYLKNNQDSWNLKYYTIARCTSNGGGNWYYAKMKVYCMRLYNKGLTTEEIVENYNTTKAYYSAIIGE